MSSALSTVIIVVVNSREVEKLLAGLYACMYQTFPLNLAVLILKRESFEKKKDTLSWREKV